jgi:hypothetical protein
MTAADRHRRAEVDLIAGAAVIGTDEVTAEVATVILQAPRQERKGLPRIGELRDALNRHRRIGGGRWGPLIRRRCGKPAAAQHGKRQAKGPQGLHRDPPHCLQEDPLGIWRTEDQCRINKGLPLLALLQLPISSARRGAPSRAAGRPCRVAAPVRTATPVRERHDRITALAVTALASTHAPRPGNDAPSDDTNPP